MGCKLNRQSNIDFFFANIVFFNDSKLNSLNMNICLNCKYSF